MRGDQLTRQWVILMHLSNSTNGKLIEQIAREAGCGTRTARRDILALQRAGFAIYTEKQGQSTLWKTSDEFRKVPPIPITLPETVALLLIHAQLKSNSGDFASQSFASLTEKIMKSRPKEFRQQMELLQEKFYSQPTQLPSRAAQTGIVERLTEAITTSHKIATTYQNAAGKSTTNRQLAPLHIWLVNNSKYLIAYCYKRKQVRSFHLNRFKSVEMLDDKYKVEWDFNMEKYAEEAFGAFHSKPEEITLLFDSLLKNYIQENPVHRSQKVTINTSGITVKIKAGINESLVSRVLSYGSLVRVLSPDRLAILVMERHRIAYEQYQTVLPANLPSLPLNFE